MARPVVGDVVQLYLAISKSAPSNVLIKEEDRAHREREHEEDRLSQLAPSGYETLPEATVVERVKDEAFRTKEVMNNNDRDLT
ncbi:hypothetical protein LIER_01006 [Lithospermum erythrorhizon]|uniref:Uncharacterized protein n=1 Tax=Lithospermum erythrorhizon TaxID=34254 RepID=A0AAV3NK62_LITER